MNPQRNTNNEAGNPPLLSIITVTLNNATGLGKTLDSITAQSMKSFEVIVVDGGSADETPDVVKMHERLVTCWISEPDKGIYDAMNKGISQARGKYLNFLNAGDVYTNAFTLETAFKPENSGSADVIYGDIILVEESGKKGRLQKARRFNRKELLKFGTGVVCHQAIFIKREIAPRYDLQWRFKAELNWYFDILEKHSPLKTVHVDAPLVIYSTGGFGQVNFWDNQAEWFRLVRQRFGWFAIFRYLLPFRLLLKLPYRYKFLRWPSHSGLKSH